MWPLWVQVVGKAGPCGGTGQPRLRRAEVGRSGEFQCEVWGHDEVDKKECHNGTKGTDKNKREKKRLKKWITN